MHRVLILGGSGMLGSMLVDYLSRSSTFSLAATVRSADLLSRMQAAYPNVRWQLSNFSDPATLASHDWILNAIGITKPLIRDDNPSEILRAVEINSRLPHTIASAAPQARILQIATDCVYSGAKGRYVETDVHDALDVYGKTKSLGECYLPNSHHLRCSIIGPEPKDYKFLIEWFRRQPNAAAVNGFTNHHWNGVTTLHFAKLCQGIIETSLALPHLQHVVPGGLVTKAQMLHDFAAAYNRPDIAIRDTEAKTIIDRTLDTANPAANRAMWQAAGYKQPPTVTEMIMELGQYDYKLDGAHA